jgi:flagellar biosynthesis protein FlhA
MALGVITRTLQMLLSEGVAIRDMRTIVETLSDAAAKTQDPEQLTAMVRPKLGRMIVQELLDTQENLAVMTLAPELEQLLHNVLTNGAPGQSVVIEPGLAESLFSALRDATRTVEDQGNPAVLVVAPSIRPWLSKMVRHRISELIVLSYTEIPDDQSVKVIYTVEAQAKS